MFGSNFVEFLMAILKRQVASSPIFVSFFSFIKHYSSVLFLSQTIYTLLKRSLLKWKVLRFWSARVKFCQIRYGNFETTSGLLSNFGIFLQFHKRLFLCNFFNSNNIYFPRKEPVKMKFFEILECLGQIFSNSFMPILKGQVASYPTFVSFFSFIKDYFSVIFLTQKIYTYLKSSPLKWKFLRFWSACVKFCQIPYANFKTTSRFLSNCCIFLQF